MAAVTNQVRHYYQVVSLMVSLQPTDIQKKMKKGRRLRMYSYIHSYDMIHTTSTYIHTN